MKTLAATDHSGVSLAKCLGSEGWAEGASRIHYDPASTLGYVEVHIEQGRVLEGMNLPAGVVTGICGQTRLAVTLTGRTDHAGTTPMALRRDALAGAAECFIELERTAAENAPLVVTVGKISIEPGASNSVPGRVWFTIDLRHPDDELRARFHDELRERCTAIAEKRALSIDWQVVQDQHAVLCDEALTARMAGALVAVTDSSSRLASGAGHDGVAMSRVAPIAMLFVRSRDGLSHHPDEFSSAEDVAIAIEVLVRFLKSFAIRS
jgi:allantoate deiminase